MYERFTDRARPEAGGWKCPRCGDVAYQKNGNQRLCRKHLRFSQMVATANRRGLLAPTHAELHRLHAVLDNMACPHCHRTMNWMRRDGSSTVISLQHYRDGSFGLICVSCNTRHYYMPDDDFNTLLPGHKWCPSCRTIKPLGQFQANNSRKWTGKRSHCRECCNRPRRASVASRQELKEYRIESVRRMLSEGIRPTEMARRLSLSRPAISQIIRRNGLRDDNVFYTGGAGHVREIH